MTGRSERLGRVAELDIGLAGELMEAVKVTPGAFYRFQRLGEAPDGADGGVIDPGGTYMLGCWLLGFAHGAPSR